jgi:hypothetical protein
MLEEVLAVANGPAGFTRESFRKWVSEPSESLRKLLDQAGIDPTAWFVRVAAFKAHWDRPGS